MYNIDLQNSEVFLNINAHFNFNFNFIAIIIRH